MENLVVEGRDTDELTLQRLHVHGSKVTCTLESKCTKTLMSTYKPNTDYYLYITTLASP